MAYPSYNDFGKSTKDFYTKGFQTGIFKLNIRDQLSKNINVNVNGTHNLEKKEASGDFQTKLTCPVLPGYMSTTKWTTGNTISQEIRANEAFAPGLDIGVEGEYNIESSSMKGKVNSKYMHDLGTIQTGFEGGDSSNPLVNASIVTGYDAFAVGYQVEVDTTERIMKKNNVAASVVIDKLKFFASLDNAELAWAGLIYKCNPALEVGATATYKSDPEGYYVVGGAVKYVMDCCTAVKAKFDSDMQLGLGFEVKVRPTATITMSTQVDGNKFNEGGHRVGLSFDLEA